MDSISLVIFAKNYSFKRQKYSCVTLVQNQFYNNRQLSDNCFLEMYRFFFPN